MVEKEESTVYFESQDGNPDNHKDHPDPFLFTDSKVMRGQATALVCCVGENTLLAKSRNPADNTIKE